MSDIERPEPDALEQEQPASGDEAVDPIAVVSANRPLEANEADVLEQAEELPVDDDFR